MKIPKTTKDKPYIEFIITDKNKIKLFTTSYFWGGKNKFFYCPEGIGNSCLPKQLPLFFEVLKKRETKNVSKQIEKLKKRIKEIKKLNICQ